MTNKNKVKAIFLITTFIIFLLPKLALGETVKYMEVLINPEFDNGDVLIMQYANFDKDKVDATLYLPGEVGESGIRAASPDQSKQNEQTPKVKKEGSQWAVSFPVLYSFGFAEGYFPLQDNNGKKSFSYKFKAPYDITSADFKFQIPPTSTGYKVVPEAKTKGKDRDGFDINTANYQNLKKGQELEFKVEYNKSDANYTASSKAVNPNNTNSSGTLTAMLAGVIVILGLIFGAVYFGSSNNKGKAKPKYSNQKFSAKKTSGSTKYCANCGKPHSKGDKFCPGCGKQI